MNITCTMVYKRLTTAGDSSKYSSKRCRYLNSVMMRRSLTSRSKRTTLMSCSEVVALIAVSTTDCTMTSKGTHDTMSTKNQPLPR